MGDGFDWAGARDALQSTCRDTFPQSFDFVPATGSPLLGLCGIWRKASVEVNENTGATVLTPEPVLDAKEADLGQEPLEGDQLVIEGLTYEITKAHSDGEGVWKMFLHRKL